MSDELTGLFEHLFESVGKLGSLVYGRTTANLNESFSALDAKQWLRLVIIVCGYMLLRQYLVKFGMKQQEKALEKQSAEDEKAAMSPNYLRGQAGIPDDSDDEDEAAALAGKMITGKKPKEPESAAATAADWGKKARRRQRNVMKKMLDAEEERLRSLQEEEEDKDIAEFLQE